MTVTSFVGGVRCLAFASVLALASPALAERTLQCPAMLRISDATLQSPDLPAGAQLGLDLRPPLRLSSIGVYSGHPRERAALVPRNADAPQLRGLERAIWRFDDADPHGTYLVCEYGEGVQVSLQVSRAVRTCTGTMRVAPAPATERAASFDCE